MKSEKESNSQSVKPKKKGAYQPPRLERYGNLKELTAAAVPCCVANDGSGSCTS